MLINQANTSIINAQAEASQRLAEVQTLQVNLTAYETALQAANSSAHAAYMVVGGILVSSYSLLLVYMCLFSFADILVRRVNHLL